jgi:hypothetical protein
VPSMRVLRCAFVAGITLVVLGSGCGNGAELGAASLLQRAKSLQSHAAEGALLAEDAAAGNTTAVYTREHASDLAQAAARDAASLKAAKVEAALEPKLRRLRAVATRVAVDLQRLGTASSNAQRRLGRELEASAQASQKIGAGLE